MLNHCKNFYCAEVVTSLLLFIFVSFCLKNFIDRYKFNNIFSGLNLYFKVNVYKNRYLR